MSKNLHDLSDDEFDDLFRDSAEKSDIGFEPDAWNKMSQKLDAASLPPSSQGKGGNPLTKWGLPAVVVLLLLITGTYFFLRKPSDAVTKIKGDTKENPVKQTDKVVEKDVATHKVDTENPENAKETTIQNDTDKVVAPDSKESTKKANETLKSTDNTTAKAEKVVSLKAKQMQENSKTDIAAKANVTRQEETHPLGSERRTKIISSDKKTTENTKTNGYKVNKKSSDGSTPANETNAVIAKDRIEAKSQLPIISEKEENNSIGKTNKQPSALRDTRTANNQKADEINSSNTVNNDLKTVVQSRASTIDSAATIEKTQWASVNALSPVIHLYDIGLKLPDVQFESPDLAPVIMPRTNTAFKRGLNIRLAISPDLSFIPSNKIFKVGNNWAAILEYRFNNRMSIQTGVIRSMKYYGALPSQYEWNAYWTMPSPLKDIDATCKMLDIPLNLRYDISQKPNSRWFVSGGFTSYIMLKEVYRYNYENPYDPNIKRKSWEGKTGAYPFSVLNLSVGYERQLFRRLTFQAEPFYKAPLGKVGYGKVRLATAGIFFSVKYPF
ncbi:hypothetical protein [Emticicia sp. C21]|uniref:hypothetical protein n=1 Tax=Emticicia sp. C21 TaxID=2302915 RepID=UPI000E3438F9|nr:hypothetical protein [Emticicia sp. C21]RFS16255.1 hypothetical protein D0T08_11235 [Emticicia sp. C21]